MTYSDKILVILTRISNANLILSTKYKSVNHWCPPK